MPETLTIPLSLIDPPAVAMRAEMDDAKLSELAESIVRQGLIHPLAVKVVQSGANPNRKERSLSLPEPAAPAAQHYEIISGHRRYVALEMAGFAEARCEVWAEDEAPSEAIKIAENLHREDVNDADIALYLHDLQAKFHYPEADLVRITGRSADWLGDRLRLFSGDKEVFSALQRRAINFGTARELNKCGDEQHRRYLLAQCIQSTPPVSLVATWVKQWKVENGVAIPQQQPAAGGEGQPAAVAEPSKCFVCSKYTNQHAMRVIFMHEWCKESLEESMGVTTGAQS